MSAQEFSALKSQIGTARNIHINYRDHDTLDRLYVMVLPDGSMTIPSGANYLSFGPFLNVTDFEQVLSTSQFDSAKHLRHSRGWGKRSTIAEQVLNVDHVDPVNFLESNREQS